jgi:hypothetical protein
VIVGADTLANLDDHISQSQDLVRLLTQSAENVLIFGFNASSRHERILRELSSQSVTGIEQADPNSAFHVTAHFRQLTGPFSGLLIESVEEKSQKVFVCAGSCDVLIEAGGKPFLIGVRSGNSQIFFCTSNKLADLDEVVPPEAKLTSWFASLAPLLMFLRGTLRDALWHSEEPRACFVIDDPLLKHRYGFLHFEKLADAMALTKFAVSIAFIPWNYRRTTRQVARMFSSSNGRFSLCVHGCDHTAAEFAVADRVALRRKARGSLEKMRDHQRLSGVPFDHVMVFPQGLFSIQAMEALKTSGFLAAVNTNLSPVSANVPITLCDLLQPAVTRFANFPLLSRRYPREVADFAFDLLVGKAVLVVEHHVYFRNGYNKLKEFVAALNGLDDRLEWTNLQTLCSQACLLRKTQTGETEVRFYCDRFSITNHHSRDRKYLLYRAHERGAQVPVVLIDERAVAVQVLGDCLKMEVTISGGRTADVRVSRKEEKELCSRELGFAHATKVWTRRMLSEFRDNYVDCNRVLSGMFSALKSKPYAPGPGSD